MHISSGNLLVCLLQISPGNLFIADQFKQSVQYIYQSLAQAICSFAVQLRQRVYCRLAQAMHFLADYPRQSVCIFKADQLRQSVSIFIASQLEHSITSIIAICFYSIFIADKLNILLLHFQKISSSNRLLQHIYNVQLGHCVTIFIAVQLRQSVNIF